MTSFAMCSTAARGIVVQRLFQDLETPAAWRPLSVHTAADGRRPRQCPPKRSRMWGRRRARERRLPRDLIPAFSRESAHAIAEAA